MKVAFRVDASSQIGSGHVMRCLTLANQLKEVGATCTFISRELKGNLIRFVKSQGFEVLSLNESKVEQEMDAHETMQVLDEPDLLVVDHYRIDVAWENMLKPHVKKLMVIDDLANRKHECDLLLDQNYYFNIDSRYKDLVPDSCRLLLGPCYVLLRDEFLKLTEQIRKRDGTIQNILVFYGGSDPTNETEKVLKAITKLPLNRKLKVNVIVGSSNPHKTEIERLCSQQSSFSYYEQVTNMAELMNEADLAIGAGGTTTWERCFVGLPSIVTVIADNQLEVTQAVSSTNAILNLGESSQVTIDGIQQQITDLLDDPGKVMEIGKAALSLVNPKIVNTYPVRKALLEVLTP